MSLASIDGIEPTDCEDGNVRLTGYSPNQGRMEICRGNVWGSICANYFSTYDADVVCRMLGYSNGEMNESCIT